MTNNLSSKETLAKEPTNPEPTPQEQLIGLLRKLEDMSVEMRSTCYKAEMLIRGCRECKSRKEVKP